MIDCHTHIGETGIHLGPPITVDAQRAWGVDFDMGVTPEQHWEAMAGVDRAVVLAFAAPAVGFVVPNEYVSRHVRAHPEKLIGFASVDPNDADAPSLLRHAVTDLGLRGLKLGPIYQHFHPHDPRAMAVYSVAAELGIPIMWHQGTTFVRDAPLEYARPALLDEVARRFPELRIVVAHLGHPWAEEAMATIRKHPNLYSDISALDGRPWQFYNGLIAALEYGVAHRLLFGSDYPFSTPQRTLEGLERVYELPREARGLPEIPREMIDELIARDSLSLLGLE